MSWIQQAMMLAEVRALCFEGWLTYAQKCASADRIYAEYMRSLPIM